MSENERICKKRHRRKNAVLFLYLEEAYNLNKKEIIELLILLKI